jgi:hypothetical protein
MNRKAITVVLLVAILVVVAVVYVILSSPPSTSARGALLFVEPKTVQLTVGQSFTINIGISNVVDLYGWELKLGWNASLLSLVGADEGPFLRVGGNTSLAYHLNVTDMHVMADCNLEGHIPGVSGNGTLATVMFNTKNVGECTLNLYDVSFRRFVRTDLRQLRS